jgi:hypothetical protein
MTLTREHVLRVYSGRRAGCRCGCRGRYYYPSSYTFEEQVQRGSAISPREVNDRMVTRVINLLNANRAHVTVSDGCYDFTAANGHVYTAYSKKGGDKN